MTGRSLGGILPVSSAALGRFYATSASVSPVRSIRLRGEAMIITSR
jgi:hypothetical protein